MSRPDVIGFERYTGRFVTLRSDLRSTTTSTRRTTRRAGAPWQSSHMQISESPDTAIVLRRVPRGWRDLARAYTVHVDGTKVGEIRRGQIHEFAVTPGPHTVV